MSGEYFCSKKRVEDRSKFQQEDKSDDDKIGDCPFGGDCPSPNQDLKLHEMGEALEIAENRCNTLKEQLDHMKNLYKQNNEIDERPEKIKEVSQISLARSRNLPRQNSGAIGTDSSGAAVVTINNILSGITQSINRLSELHTYMETDQRPSTRKKRFRDSDEEFEKVRSNEGHYSEDDNRRALSQTFYRPGSNTSLAKHKRKEPKKRPKRRNVGAVEQSSASLIHMKSKTKTNRTKDDTMDSSTAMKKQRKQIKRLKQISKTSMVQKRLKHIPGEAQKLSNNLVEIYHNKAAKASESDESQTDLHEASFSTKISHVEVKPKLKKSDPLPPIPIIESRIETMNYGKMENRTMLTPIEEQVTDDQATRTEYTNFMHNYEAPTIASRMKQVAKSYFRQFSSKTIPFCAAKSTTPSHNIGINIQQVMNIIKTRQPIKGISPTLAHNIGIAAEKLNNHSLSAVVSSFSSRMGCNYYPCPMLRTNMNFQHLQEMAKEIPEIPEELETQDNGEDKQVEEVMRVSASRLMNYVGNGSDLQNQQTDSVWAVDPAQVNCTCIPRQGIGFQQMLNKYQQFAMPHSGTQSQYSQKIMQRSNQKYRHIKSIYAQYNDGRRKRSDSPIQSLIDTKTDTKMPLKGKEKVLKGVLVNLHNEFEQLSNKYDELSKVEQCDNNGEDRVKELECLEKKLNDKEDEIQMVMSLYSEVVNLKQQVRTLREKASLASLMVEQQKQQYILNQKKSELYPVRNKDTKGAVHLTKLLRHIQTYQEVSKTGGK